MPGKISDRENLKKHITLTPRVNEKLNYMLDYFEKQKSEGKNLVEPTYTDIIIKSIEFMYSSVKKGEWEKGGRVWELE